MSAFFRAATTSSKKQNPPRVTTRAEGGPFASSFFEALNQGDPELALARLNSEAFLSLPDGAPSPRAEEYVKSGEWDTATVLSLVLVDEDACFGRVGQDGYRFCGKQPRTSCPAQAHQKQVVKQLTPGWYVSAGGKGSGLFASPKLPRRSEGGPIMSSGAAVLADRENPFKMTKGMWRFVIDAWLEEPSEHSVVFSVPSDLTMVQEATEVPDPDEDEGNEYGDVEPGGANVYAEGNDDDEGDDEQSPDDKAEPSFRGMAASSGAGSVSARVAPQQQKARGDVAGGEAPRETLMLRKRVESLEFEAHRRKEQFNVLAGQVEHARHLLEQSNRTLTRYGQALQAASLKIDQLELEQQHQHTDQDQAGQLERLTHEVFDSQGSFPLLKLQFTQLRDRLESGGGIDCHGIRFSSKRELISWYNARELKIVNFVDALAMMHSIRNPVVHQDEASKQREAQVKTEMSSGLDASVKFSFETTIPSILVGGKKLPEGGGAYDWLKSYLKSYEVWKRPGMSTGLGQQIIDGVDKVERRLAEMRDDGTTDSSAVRLSIYLAQDAVRFCNAFVRFVDDQQDDLTTDTTFSSEQIWPMQVECILKIVEELSEARDAVVDAARHNEAYFLWGMLRAWQIQQRYLENHFKDDPALTGIMVRRILVQGQDTSVKAKLAKIDTLQHKVEENHRVVMGEVRKLQAAAAKNNPKA